MTRRRTSMSAAATVVLVATLAVPSMALGQDDDTAADNDALVLTPAQAEGPFYPVEIPADRDADLTVVEGAAAPALGTPLRVEGTLVHHDGTPIEGATVEIWQTDDQGIYLHPDDPGFADLDPGFQGYGESITDSSGAWSFETILPNVYGSRPRHIHAKVRIDGAEALTTQIYFVDQGVGLTGAVALTGTELDELIVELEPVAREDGVAAFVATHAIVIE